MNNYPQYIHVPTTVPVQRYFADPYVYTNRYDIGGLINDAAGKLGNVFGGQGSKITAGLGKFGLDATSIGGAVGQGLYSIGIGKFDRGTGAGKAISGIGNAVGGIVGKVNPLLGGIVKAGSGLVGGLVNRISGYHLNDATINAINNDVNEMNNTRVTDSSNESIANQAAAQNWGSAFDIHDIGSWGWAAKGKVENEYNKLQKAMASGQNYMAANYDNAETNVSKNMMNNLLMNSAAFGGYFDNPFSHPGSGAVAYGIEQQNLANQQQMIGQMQQQNQMQQPMQKQYGFGGCMPFCFGGRFFSGGGSLNNHGSDFTNGLIYIENGGTHEENPYQGVPMGYDSRGVPNVVEEDEVIAPKRLLGDGGDSDYVFSNRITITDEFADKYHLPHGISVSKAVEVFTKESRETPNDPIHENTNKKFLAEARDMQEQVKAEQQQQQMAMAQQVMQQLPPEQQQAMAQQAMQQEGEMAMQEQAPEAAMIQQGPETSQPSMVAFGGNLFAPGGRLITLGDIPRGFVDEYGDTIVSFPSGNRVPLSTAYTEYAPTHVYVEDIPHLSDYMMRQEQPDIATTREVINEQNRRKRRGSQEAINSAYWTGANLAWLMPAIKGLFDYTAGSGAADAVLGAVESGPFKGFPNTPGEFNQAFNSNPYLYGRLHRWIRNSGIPEKIASGLNKAEDFAGKVVDYFNSDDAYPEAAIPGGGAFGGAGGGGEWGDGPEYPLSEQRADNIVDDVVFPVVTQLPARHSFGGNLYSNGGYFQPVNMFATRGSKPAGNQYADGYNAYRAWEAYMLPIIGDLFSGLNGKSPEEVEAFLKQVNELQDAYDAANLYGDDLSIAKYDDKYGTVQRLAQDLGLNSAFTDDFFNTAIQPGSYKRQTTDNPTRFVPDNWNGGLTKLRNFGIRIPESDNDWGKFRDTIRDTLGIEAYLPAGSDVYRYKLVNSPTDKGYLTESELDDLQNQEQEAYTPVGDGSNPEEDTDDRYQFNPAIDGRYTMPWLSTAGRDLPIWEAGLARLLDDIGLGTKPDYTYANGLEELARQSQGYMPVSYKPSGERMKPVLFDPYQPMLNADAQYGTASRAIQDNSNGNGAAANAAQVALARNAMIGNGAIGETGQKFNADQYRNMLDFNRTTDMQNSQGILSADAQNAHNWAQARNLFGYRMEDALQARKAEKDAVDAIKLNNRKMFTDAVAKKAKENMYFNMVNHNPANGGYGMDPRYGSPIYNGAFENGTPWWGNPNTRQAGQRPTMATNPYVQNQPFNFGSFLNGLFNPYG